MNIYEQEILYSSHISESCCILMGTEGHTESKVVYNISGENGEANDTLRLHTQLS